MNVDLYSILGLNDVTSSSRAIKKAYIVLARQLHPDKNFGNRSDRFLLVQVAYEVLGDNIKRRLYDIGRQRRSGSFASSSPSSSSTPTRRKHRRQPPEAYDWTKDLSSAASQRKADVQRFNKWKEALFRDLDEIEASLRAIPPSPQKANLLRTMIDRVDQMRADATANTVTCLVQSTTTADDDRISTTTSNDEKDSTQNILSITTTSKYETPGDDFLAFLSAKKKRSDSRK
jgi:curved DNA-binding protein CbpA